MRTTSERSRWAVGALLLTMGVRGYQLLVHVALRGDYVRSSALIEVGALAETGTLLLTTVLFLRWLSRVVTLTRATRTHVFPWTESTAVWSFFIPLISLYRPYQVLRDLHDQLAPDGVPEPAPRPRLDGAGGYRSIPMEKAPAARTLPHASIGAWWGLFLLERMLGTFGSMASQILAIAAAALAVLVVRAVEGRLEERYRRVSYASDEELEEWGIEA